MRNKQFDTKFLLKVVETSIACLVPLRALLEEFQARGSGVVGVGDDEGDELTTSTARRSGDSGGDVPKHGGRAKRGGSAAPRHNAPQAS